MQLQLANCPIVKVGLRPTEGGLTADNKQHTNQMHTACYKAVGLNPTAPNIFLSKSSMLE